MLYAPKSACCFTGVNINMFLEHCFNSFMYLYEYGHTIIGKAFFAPKIVCNVSGVELLLFNETIV